MKEMKKKGGFSKKSSGDVLGKSIPGQKKSEYDWERKSSPKKGESRA